MTKEEYTDEQIMDKAHHIFLNSAIEDSYFLQNYSPSPNQAKVDIPHEIPLSHTTENDTVHHLRQRLRLNKIDNLQFDPALSNENDTIYRGIYEANKQPTFDNLTLPIGDFVVKSKNLHAGPKKRVFVNVSRVEKEMKKLGKVDELDEKVRRRRKILKEIPQFTVQRFFEQIAHTKESKKWDKDMDYDLKEQILNYYDEAIKKFYPNVQRDEMRAKFKLYDQLTEEGYEFDFSELEKEKQGGRRRTRRSSELSSNIDPLELQ